ncbi:MAG: branched-chain amino acid ABC transporter permease [Candidatus Odinarchaeota archaeon]
MFATDLIEVLFIGSTEGAVTALVAIGFSLVYGVGGVTNLAHGSFFMLAGYWLLWILTWGPIFTEVIWLSVVIVLIIITCLGAILYITLIKPLQESPINMILITFAVGFFVELIVKFISGTSPEPIDEYRIASGHTQLLGYEMDYQALLLILISLITITIFGLFINKSKLGKSVRAVSQDKEAATLMGINSDRILLITFIIASFLAALAAYLALPYYNLNGPAIGWQYLTNSMAVVILGGLGSLTGSVAAAFILGYARSFTLVFIPDGSIWFNVVPMIVIIVMLLVRPHGMFGKKELK